MIKILYFARLREALGKSAEEIELPRGAGDLDALRALLRERGGAWADEMAEGRQLRAAVNQDLAHGDVALRDGDEIAFFPPVTGG